MDLLDKLYIINDIDRPCMHLICREIGDRMIYVSEYFRRRHPNLKKDNTATSLMDFGFIYTNGKYELRNKSVAKYYDGSSRKWQGNTSFTYQDIVTSNFESD